MKWQIIRPCADKTADMTIEIFACSSRTWRLRRNCCWIFKTSANFIAVESLSSNICRSCRYHLKTRWRRRGFGRWFCKYENWWWNSSSKSCRISIFNGSFSGFFCAITQCCIIIIKKMMFHVRNGNGIKQTWDDDNKWIQRREKEEERTFSIIILNLFFAHTKK